MLTDIYVFNDSPLHRMRPGLKILALVLVCSVLFIFEGWITLALGAVLVAVCFTFAGLHLRHGFAALRPTFWVLLAIFLVQVYLAGFFFAAFVVLRFAVLILAAALVTATTRTSEMVDGILDGLRFAPSWVPKNQIALGLSLCLRFIPLIMSVFHDVRQAQRARGLDLNPMALLVPLVVRTLKTADEVSQAIQARSFD